MSRAQKQAGTAAALATALCLAGCGGGSSASAPPRHPSASSFLSIDSPARQVRLTMALAYDKASSSQNIDGAVKGALLFSVPLGWRVTVECADRSSTTRYACALVPSPGVPVGQRRLVYVYHPAGGLAPGARASFAFTAASPSRYRMVALTQKDGTWSPSAGMWVVLRVSQGGLPTAQWLR